MAKILFSAVVADARKKLAGTVFSKSRFGAYMRTKTSPVQPRTTPQRNVRAQFTANAKAWSGTLTSAQRQAFTNLAAANPKHDRFGNSQTLTGAQMYQSLNRNLNTIGVSPISAAPASLSVGSPSTLTLVNAAGPPTTFTVTSATAPATAEVPTISATAYQNSGRTFVGKKARLILTIAAGTAGPWDIKAAYLAKWGAPPVGSAVFVEVVYINNASGAKGTPSQNSIVIANVL
jgi:hypothetical protein